MQDQRYSSNRLADFQQHNKFFSFDSLIAMERLHIYAKTRTCLQTHTHIEHYYMVYQETLANNNNSL